MADAKCAFFLELCQAPTGVANVPKTVYARRNDNVIQPSQSTRNPDFNAESRLIHNVRCHKDLMHTRMSTLKRQECQLLPASQMRQMA